MAVNTRLKDVPETMLWTLHNRATEAIRVDGIIDDKKAIDIYQSIDYNYEKSFGKAEPSHAIRSLDFDREIRNFIHEHPEGTIVNLGEGLETQRFRIDAPNALWITVDLPDAIKARELFILPDEQHRHMSCSATDSKWMQAVPKERAVFISAQGLFMCFDEDAVKGLLQEIDQTFQHWVLMFDTIPEWLSKKTLSKRGWVKTPSYTAPKMPWGINRYRIQSTLKSWLSKGVSVQDLGYSAFPRGLVKWVFLAFSHTPILKNMTPTIVKLRNTPAAVNAQGH